MFLNAEEMYFTRKQSVNEDIYLTPPKTSWIHKCSYIRLISLLRFAITPESSQPVSSLISHLLTFPLKPFNQIHLNVNIFKRHIMLLQQLVKNMVFATISYTQQHRGAFSSRLEFTLCVMCIM